MDDIQKELKDVQKKIEDIEKKQEMLKRIQDLGIVYVRKSKQNDPLDILMKSDIIDNRNKSTMIRQLITEFPLSDVPKERTVTEEKIRKYTYTKEEVDILIANAVKEAVEEAVKIDEASMAKHNRDATVISMILGFTTLALFVDGLLRMLELSHHSWI